MNIPNSFCSTCLSRDRQMFPLPMQHVQAVSMLFKDLKLSEFDFICWECNCFVKKMAAFRNRALIAQTKITAVLSKKPTLLTPLSKLKVTKGISIDFNPVKQEPGEKSDPFTDAIKSDSSDAESDNEDHDLKSEQASGDEGIFEVIQNSCEQVKEIDVFRFIPGGNKNAVQSGQGTGNAMLTSIMNNTKLYYPPQIAQVLPMMEIPTLKIPSGLTPTTEINAQNLVEVTLEDMELESPDSSPSFTEERLTEKEKRAWWKSKKETEFYNSVDAHRCDKCAEPFFTDRTFLLHKKLHTEMYGKLSCDVCKLRFRTEDALAEHKDRHYRLLQCSQCAHAWDSPNSMRHHCQTEHSIPVTLWNCDLCPRTLTTLGRYLWHVRGHGSEECPYCHKTIFANQLKVHIQDTHKKVERPYKCPQCDKRFKIKSVLDMHMGRVHSANEDMMFCAQCDKQFKNIYSYNNHMRFTAEHVTQEQLKYHCTECSKVCASAGQLRTHIASRHSEEPRYKCQVCDEKFRSSSSRSRHRREVHENFVAPKDKICSFCGKGFTTKSILQSHINSHTGERPFVCKLCGADFGHKSALYLHGRLKHKIAKKTKNNKPEVDDDVEEAVYLEIPE